MPNESLRLAAVAAMLALSLPGCVSTPARGGETPSRDASADAVAPAPEVQTLPEFSDYQKSCTGWNSGGSSCAGETFDS